MDSTRFDDLLRSLALGLSRRATLGAALSSLLATGSLAIDGEDAAAKRKHKKRKKKKKCTNGAIKCSNACVDTKSNAAHCGGCNRPCKGDLTCSNGECGCAEGAKCGNACVDLQTDPDHCGACNAGCTNDDSCVGGECTPSECGQNQIDCGNGLCIPNHEHACCGQNDCGGSNSQLHCNTALHRCVCNNSGEGLCRRAAIGNGGFCHTCCPGGSEVCPNDDEVCFFEDSEGICDCPTGYERCSHPFANLCSQDKLTDIHRCGTHCTDCETTNPGSRCCQGACSRGTDPGHYSESGMLCGNNCQLCPSGQICCNRGPGTSGECVVVELFAACPVV